MKGDLIQKNEKISEQRKKGKNIAKLYNDLYNCYEEDERKIKKQNDMLKEKEDTIKVLRKKLKDMEDKLSEKDSLIAKLKEKEEKISIEEEDRCWPPWRVSLQPWPVPRSSCDCAP